MKNNFIIFILVLSHFLNAQNKLSFTENKGQVSDQNFHSRNDILFAGSDGQLSFHLKNNGISYQLYRIDEWKEDNSMPPFPGRDKSPRVVNKRTIYRIDVDWLNANTRAVIKKDEALPGYNNYYLPACPNGALEVMSFKQITYQNIYPGIDLKWFEKNNCLKYDYIIAAGADYKQIQMKFAGAESLSLNAKGELIIKTPLGKIIEQAPYVIQNGRQLKASWKIKNNIVSFIVADHNPTIPFVIDPGVRQWGTYYGGTADDLCWSTVCDASGNIYTSGYTSSSAGGINIATIGSHQSAHSGNGMENALVTKFTPGGTRIWGTYYGGNVRDIGLSCALDPSNNVFMCGYTMSNNAGSIATPGAIQTVAGGQWDAFFVKFNSSGVRQWGTFYGSASGDFGYGCAADAAGNSYLCGRAGASAGTVFATPGSHQPAYDAFEDGFLVKFDPNGTRLWGTYYGGESVDISYDCATDVSGNVYLAGTASSTGNIATPGCHQNTYGGGGSDAFLAKFNGSGIRQWSTYYGGNAEDKGLCFCRDETSGNLYLGGITVSIGGNGIATDGSHQNTFGGGAYDGFIAKFNSLGNRLWGTYYGGSGDDRVNSCAVNPFDHVYLAGYSNTGTGTIIASAGSHQSVYGGGPDDGFLAQFNTVGTRLWATYYGGPGYDLGQGCTTDNNSNVYFCGLSDVTSGTVISTPGSQQSVYGGGTSDGFIVKFYDCVSPASPANLTAPGNQFLCAGNSTTLSANGTGTISWYNVPNAGSVLITGTNYATPVLSNGTYTFYAEANTCTNSVLRTPVIVTVNPLPNIFISTSNTLLCAGQTATLYTAGVATHTWNTGANTGTLAVSPSVTTTYTISGTDNNGCVNSTIITQSVTICPVGFDRHSSNGGGIVVYPNPSSSLLIISGAAPLCRITVYNSTGQIMIDDSNETLKNEISLADFASGIYFVKVLQDNHPVIIKVIKK